MSEITCSHPACRCTISSTSPDKVCCDYCAEHVADTGRCGCDHDACGGVPRVDLDPRELIKPELDPTLGRKA